LTLKKTVILGVFACFFSISSATGYDESVRGTANGCQEMTTEGNPQAGSEYCGCLCEDNFDAGITQHWFPSSEKRQNDCAISYEKTCTKYYRKTSHRDVSKTDVKRSLPEEH